VLATYLDVPPVVERTAQRFLDDFPALAFVPPCPFAHHVWESSSMSEDTAKRHLPIAEIGGVMSFELPEDERARNKCSLNRDSRVMMSSNGPELECRSYTPCFAVCVDRFACMHVMCTL